MEVAIPIEIEKSWMTVSQFCAAYSISRATFYKEVQSKRLKITKLKSSTYVTKKNADAWMDLIASLSEEKIENV